MNKTFRQSLQRNNIPDARNAEELNTLIMDLKTPEELYNYMKDNIRYGFYSNVSHNIYIRSELNNDFLYEYMLFYNYCLQKPEEMIKTKVGICFDQVEFERKWFVNHGYKVYTFFCNFHNHAFLVYENNGKYYYFERTVKKLNGIHEANSLEDILDEYKKQQLSDCSFENFKIYEYMSVPFGANLYEIISSVSNRDIDKIEDIIKWGRTNFDILKKQSIQLEGAEIWEQTI